MAEPQDRQKTVLITGCTPGGIGYALATQFQAKGFFVIATVRNANLLSVLRSKGMTAIQLDVADEASIAACRDSVERITDGRLDILVNNAGRGLTLPCTDTPLSTARSVYETNLFSVISLVTHFTPLLLSTRGLIINIASISALVPYVFGSIYASSKAALVSYSRTLRAELRPFGVRVMVAMAGTVRSNMGVKSVQRAGEVGGGLPAGSLYARVRGLYEARLGYSQRKEMGTMDTDTFARELVRVATKKEVGAAWRAVGFGRPDWWWYGGQAGLVYWASWLGEWAFDWGVWNRFGLESLKVLVDEERKDLEAKGD